MGSTKRGVKQPKRGQSKRGKRQQSILKRANQRWPTISGSIIPAIDLPIVNNAAWRVIIVNDVRIVHGFVMVPGDSLGLRFSNIELSNNDA